MKDKREGVGGGGEPRDCGPHDCGPRGGTRRRGRGRKSLRPQQDSRKSSVAPTAPPSHHGESSSQSRLRGDFHISKDPACVRPLITAHHGLGIAWGQQEARLNEGSW